MPTKGKKGKKGLRAVYLKLSSLGDLAKALSGERSYALALKSGSGYKIMCEAEQIGDAKMILYFETGSIGRYIVYSADEESGERAEMVDDLAQRSDRYKSQKTPIVEIQKDPYSPADKGDLKKIQTLEIKDQDALIRALVNGMGEDEQLRVYSFAYKGERVIGTMDLISDRNKVFAYSRTGSKDQFGTISYDYNSDIIEVSKSPNGTSKIHIRVINLAEQPQFLKE